MRSIAVWFGSILWFGLQNSTTGPIPRVVIFIVVGAVIGAIVGGFIGVVIGLIRKLVNR